MLDPEVLISSPVGAIRQAIRPLVGALAAPRSSDDEGPGALVNPADLLGVSLDLGGSIDLSEFTGALEEPLMGPAPPPVLGPPICVEVKERLDRLEGSALRRMREIPSGRSRLPVGQIVFAELEQRGLNAHPTARGHRALGRALCEPYTLALANCIDRVRGETRALRLEIGPDLSALGPSARRLQELDDLLCRARNRSTTQLFARLPAAYAQAYTAGLERIIKERPKEISDAVWAESFEAWDGPDGFTTEMYRLGGRLVAGVLQSGRRDLMGFVEIACHLDVDRNQVEEI